MMRSKRWIVPGSLVLLTLLVGTAWAYYTEPQAWEQEKYADEQKGYCDGWDKECQEHRTACETARCDMDNAKAAVPPPLRWGSDWSAGCSDETTSGNYYNDACSGDVSGHVNCMSSEGHDKTAHAAAIASEPPPRDWNTIGYYWHLSGDEHVTAFSAWDGAREPFDDSKSYAEKATVHFEDVVK